MESAGGSDAVHELGVHDAKIRMLQLVLLMQSLDGCSPPLALWDLESTARCIISNIEFESHPCLANGQDRADHLTCSTHSCRLVCNAEITLS